MIRSVLTALLVCISCSSFAWAESPTQWVQGYDGSDAATVSLWHMNEGLGSAAADVKGVSQVISPWWQTPPSWVDGRFDKCLSFDGTSNAVYTESSPSSYAFGAHPFTAEAWIKPTGSQTTGFIMDATYSWSLRYGSGTDTLQAYIGDIDQGVLLETSQAVLSPDVWQHVAMTYGGPGGYLRLWVNGSKVAETAINSAAVQNSNFNTAPHVTFGRWTYGGDYYYAGAIDEVRISNVERTFASVPEPASLFVLMSGSVALIGAALRRKH